MRRALILSLIVLLAVGCVSTGEPAQTPAASQPGAPPSASPSAGADERGTPALGPTATIPASPTVNPPVRMTNAELQERLDPFTPGVEDCSLPCYNGLTPGEEGFAAVMNFYARLGIGERDFLPGDYYSVQDGEGQLGAWLSKTTDIAQAEEQGLAPPLVDVGLEGYEAQYIAIGWQYLPSFLAVERVVDSSGTPAQIDVALYTEQPTDYAVRLLYPEQRTGVLYFGSAVQDGDVKQVCISPDQVNRTFFRVTAVDSPYMEMSDLSGTGQMQAIDEVLGMATAEAAGALLGSGCLRVPIEAWGG